MYVFSLLKQFQKENLSNLFSFLRLFADILLQNHDKNSTTLCRVVLFAQRPGNRNQRSLE